MADLKVSPRPQDEVSSPEDYSAPHIVDEKKVPVDISADPSVDVVDEEEEVDIHHPANQDDILTQTLHVQDDPTLNCFTFRTWFLGPSLLCLCSETTPTLADLLISRCRSRGIWRHHLIYLLFQTANRCGIDRLRCRPRISPRRESVHDNPKERMDWEVVQSSSFQREGALGYHCHGEFSQYRRSRYRTSGGRATLLRRKTQWCTVDLPFILIPNAGLWTRWIDA